jgi:hypothetical protein
MLQQDKMRLFELPKSHTQILLQDGVPIAEPAGFDIVQAVIDIYGIIPYSSPLQ